LFTSAKSADDDNDDGVALAMSFCTWRSDNTDVTGYVADGAASLTLGVHIVTTAYTSPV